MMVAMTRHHKAGWIGLAVVALVLTVPMPASAFYFVGWPASSSPPTPTFMSSRAPEMGGPSLGDPFNPGFEKPPGVTTPTSTPRVPEPATGLMGLIGLGVAAWAYRRRREATKV